MVQVYMPMGYQILEGNQFANVLYQGTVVRLYQLPKDPRTDAQLEQRRFLSDVTRMRANLGVWGKGLCKYAMGTKWSTILYQAIKADIGQWWTSALAEWDSLSSGEKDSFREFAPYQATFNDMGLIFFALSRVIYAALENWGGYGWAAGVLLSNSGEEVLSWWNGEAVGQIAQGVWEEDQLNLQMVGSWSRVADASASGGHYMLSANAAGQWCTFIYYGKKFLFDFVMNTEGGAYLLYVDEVLMDSGSFNWSVPNYNGNSLIAPARKGVHVVRLERETGRINLDDIQVY